MRKKDAVAVVGELSLYERFIKHAPSSPAFFFGLPMPRNDIEILSERSELPLFRVQHEPKLGEYLQPTFEGGYQKFKIDNTLKKNCVYHAWSSTTMENTLLKAVASSTIDVTNAQQLQREYTATIYTLPQCRFRIQLALEDHLLEVNDKCIADASKMSRVDFERNWGLFYAKEVILGGRFLSELEDVSVTNTVSGTRNDDRKLFSVNTKITKDDKEGSKETREYFPMYENNRKVNYDSSVARHFNHANTKVFGGKLSTALGKTDIGTWSSDLENDPRTWDIVARNGWAYLQDLPQLKDLPALCDPYVGRRVIFLPAAFPQKYLFLSTINGVRGWTGIATGDPQGIWIIQKAKGINSYTIENDYWKGQYLYMSRNGSAYCKLSSPKADKFVFCIEKEKGGRWRLRYKENYIEVADSSWASLSNASGFEGGDTRGFYIVPFESIYK
jgi:hypothetical protein